MSSDKKTEEIYAKLFSALEEGKKKQETSILKELVSKYNVPNDEKIAKFLAENIPVEQVFQDIVRYAAPFSEILKEIYRFLDQHRGTVLGKADQFAFHFEDMKDRVPFGLDSFPKTYVDVLSAGIVELFSFNLDAKGTLLVDSGGSGTWRETNALQNIGNHGIFYQLLWLLEDGSQAKEFINAHKGIVEEIVRKARIVIHCLQNSHIYREHSVPEITSAKHYYYHTDADADSVSRVISDFKANRVDSFSIFRIESPLDKEHRRFLMNGIHEFLTAWGQYPNRVSDKRQEIIHVTPTPPTEERFRLLIDSFQLAYDLVFPRMVEKIEFLDRLIEDVILPFWRHRWRLYEVWALVFTIGQAPKNVDVNLYLEPRPDMDGAFEWPIPHGDASHAVAEIKKNEIKLNVWFQRKTPHLLGTGHIEPDIRIMTASPLPEAKDVFILELKDRYNGPIRHIRKVAENYSTGSLAQHICIANYSQFSSKELQNRLTTWEVAGKTVFLADQFRPNQIYMEIKKAIKESIEGTFSSSQIYDLIFDVSQSVAGTNILDQLHVIINKKGNPNNLFAFSDRLQPVGNSLDKLRFRIEGGTDPITALNE